MKRVGITGGIGSGKSTVCKIFAALKVPVYDADTRARCIQNNNKEVVEEIKQLFGKEAYLQDGNLNKTYIAAEVFKNKDKLLKLNHIVHPKVFQDFEDWCAVNQKSPYVLKEAALMFETDSWKSLDKIIVVTAPHEMKVQRVMERDPHRTREDILAIMAKQLPDEAKIAKADFVLINDEKELLVPQVLQIDQSLRE